MNFVDVGIGFVVGLLVGVGITLWYLRWKMLRQLSAVQDQMGSIMDLDSQMPDDLEGLGEPEGVEDVEEVTEVSEVSEEGSEEKEEK